MSGPVWERTLSNGLTLLLQRDGALPLVAMEVLLRWGAGDERPEEQGAAHFLEHMVFRGTARFAPGELDRAIEGLGGELNAWTGYDHTAFHLVVPSAHVEEALGFLAELVIHPLLDPDQLVREREVVLEEIGESNDSPEQVLDQLVRARLFPGSPLGAPILGTKASLSAIDHHALGAFHRRGYTPERAVLSLAGDLDADAARAAAERLFGGWERGQGGAPLPAPPPAPGGLTRVKRGFHTPWIQLGWRVPPAGHEDSAALELLTSLLGGGAASLLGSALEQESELAFGTWCTLEQLRRGGALYVGFQPRERGALDEALAVIEQVARDGVSASELDRARLRMLADLDWDNETLDARAHEVGRQRHLYGPGTDPDRIRAALAAVEPHHLQEVAARWLAPEALTGVFLDTAWAPSKALRRSPAPPDRSGWTLANGVRVELLHRPGRLFGMSGVVLGGSLLEGPRQGGLARAWARMVGTATLDLEVEAFSLEQDRAAVNLEARAGLDQVSFEVSAPSASVREAFDLFGASLTEPVWDPEEWDRTREELLQDIIDTQDRPDEVALQAAWAALWRGHPWQRSPLGTPSSLGRLGPRSIGLWHQTQLRGGGLAVAIAGAVSPGVVEEHLLPWLEKLPGGSPPLGERPAPRPQPGALLREAGRSQASLMLALPGAAMGTREATALQLASIHLSRQGGPLVQALREQRGLAYSVWADSVAGLDGGVFALGASTRPARAEEALDGLRDQWRAICQQGLSLPQLDEARRLWRVQLLGSRQSVLSLAGARAAALLLGREWELPELEARLASFTVAEVLAALQARAEGAVEVSVRPRP
ncbi:MAG: insulinase family protein [Deltaproteobacteria bacterium]|nr:insulinase family protein [Deltaproteobacteria bacterium]